MGRLLRGLAAVVAVVAVAAPLPAPCPCPEPAPVHPAEHACCAPPTGVSASDHACCDAHERVAADLLTPAAAPAPTCGVAAVRVEPVARLAAAPPASVVSFPSPPPTVLRI